MDAPPTAATPRPFAALSRLLIALLALITLTGSIACRDSAAGDSPAPTRRPGPLRIVVSIPPLLWPARELAPKDATITLLVPPGASEHDFELSPSQVAAIHDADLVVMVGLGLEPRVQQIIDARAKQAPHRRVVTFDGLVTAIAHDEHDHDHAHDHDDHHNHDHATDPHVWLDPVAMGALIDRLSEALRTPPIRLALTDPAHDPDRIAARATELASECRAIDTEYRAAFADGKIANRVIVTHHSAFAYIARRYNLEVAAVIRPFAGVEPTPAEVSGALDAVRSHNLGAIFIEPQFPPGSAARIAEIAKVRTISLDPLGDGDWPKLMRTNLAALVDGLAAPAPSSAPSPSGRGPG
ncbi:MAG TPA: metal ABC transporter substrate-binding protein [Phycisphaerales bacterium]|nr:metal ABC transporter substrate-binding protein [Phycisphaerales bacterium]